MENSSLLYLHNVEQRRLINQFSEEDWLLIRLKSYKCSVWRRVSGGPITSYHEKEMGRGLFQVQFSHFKQHLSDPDSNCYEREFSAELKEDEHPSIVQSIFRVVEAAVSPENPVVVEVWEATHRVGPNSIPASRSFIRGLEPMTVVDADTTSSSSCAVCLEDFEQEPFAMLPCTHQFHVHCIVQCLENNHLPLPNANRRILRLRPGLLNLPRLRGACCCLINSKIKN